MRLLSSLLLILSWFILAMSCQDETVTQKVTAVEEATPPEPVTTPQFATENEAWLYYAQRASDSLQQLYAVDAVKILANGTPLTERTAIVAHYQAATTIDSIYTDTLIEAHRGRSIEYEIGGYTDQAQQAYQYLAIWQTIEGQRRRVFEFVEKQTVPKANLAVINRRRDAWIRQCNKNQAKQLVSSFYSKNTIYYNHKPLIVGRAALTAEYQYMNSPEYELVLLPSKLTAVNSRTVFEIGQCQGSYQGKYILIWRKEKDGVWRIFIDANI